jgi:hypothetical protein
VIDIAKVFYVCGTIAFIVYVLVVFGADLSIFN